MKYLLSVTGTTTVGKTTFVKLLTSLEEGLKITVIPQTTSRIQRDDDEELMMRNIDKEEFGKSEFFVAHGNYGIVKQDFVRFLKSNDSDIAVCVNGANEIEQIPPKGQIDGIPFTRVNILIRFSDNLEEEVGILKEEIPKFFEDESQIKDRITSNKSLMKEKFFNEDFLHKNIDIVLSRKNSTESWINQIKEKTGLELGKINQNNPNPKTRNRSGSSHLKSNKCLSSAVIESMISRL